jgi:hypothetical protein
MLVKLRVVIGVGLAQPMRKRPNPGRKRIQGDAAEHSRRLVAQARGHPGVGRFVKAKREDENDKFEQLQNDGLLTHERTWIDGSRKAVVSCQWSVLGRRRRSTYYEGFSTESFF